VSDLSGNVSGNVQARAVNAQATSPADSLTGVVAPAPPETRVLGVRVSPLTRRRWEAFRANKRGFVSLWLFLILFGISLPAELIANDKPLYVNYAGQHFFPVFQAYPETAFGGDFETEADYRDPFVQDLINENGWTVWPLIHSSYNTVNFGLPQPAPSPPSRQHWLGTDDQARDVLAGLIYGVRLTLLFSLILTTLSSLVGIAAGLIQGFFGGWVDLLFQRFMEIWGGIPTLYLLIILSSFVETTFWVLLGFMLLFSWTGLVGVVRAEVLRARNFDFVRAAKALGVRNRAIMVRHILPNALVATFTFLPFVLVGAVTALASLDFLGFGLRVGAPSLGDLLNQGKTNLQAPWLGITGFATLAVLLTLLVFIGEAVRDAFDVRKTLGRAVMTPSSDELVEGEPA
jgi:microcin C transport system permease protein